MFAEVIGIGRFSNSIVGHLEYPISAYEETKDGAIISCVLFGIAEGNSVSRELASCLGISAAWNFNQHHIQTENVDLEALKEFANRYDHYQKDVEAFIALHNAGFEFHFCPNG